MVRTLLKRIDFSEILLKILNWLNTPAMEVLKQEKEKHKEELEMLKEQECLFFNEKVEVYPSKEDVRELYENKRRVAEKKTEERSKSYNWLRSITGGVLIVLVWVKAQEGFTFKQELWVFLGILIFAHVALEIQKRTIVSLRLSAYRCRLDMLYLESSYPQYLPGEMTIDKARRAPEHVPLEDRDIFYSPYSQSNLQLVTIFCIRIFLTISTIILSLI